MNSTDTTHNSKLDPLVAQTLQSKQNEHQDFLEQLEFKIAFQEDTIEQLNQVVTAQQQSIATLEKTQKLIIEKLKGLQNTTSNINADNELPPHY